MDISVVIPLYNEAESLPELEAWIERVMKEHNFTYEIIFVNDGRTLVSERSNSAGITANLPDCIAVSNVQKEMSSSPWMPICRTVRTRYPNYTA